MVKEASKRNSALERKLPVVEEKSTKPPGVPRFQRVPTLSISAEDATSTIDAINAASICQHMLTKGYVQSYVDFYYLTHRLDPNVTDENNTTTIAIPQDELIFIRDNLIRAETSRRLGDTVSVYTSFNNLADFYIKHKDWKTGFFFHEKCLEVSQLTNDIRAEMTANHSLGVINQLMQNYEKARKHHERHEQLASTVDVFEEIARANAELYKVYLVLAEKSEAEGSIDKALDMYNKCLDAAKKSWDKAAEAEANGRIGNVLLSRGETKESIPFLKQQSQLAADLGHPESRCKACTSLALAWDRLGQSDKALSELTLVHAISEQAGDAFLQAQACRALGTLYSKMGRLDAAVDILQRHFGLLKSILYRSANPTATNGKKEDESKQVTAMDLDLARTYIGISKGNQLLGSYVVAIQFDLSSLLDWKLNRSEIQKTGQNAKGLADSFQSGNNDFDQDADSVKSDI